MDISRLQRMSQEAREELQRQTAAAIERGREETRKRAEAEELQEKLKQREQELKAEMVIAQIPLRAEQEARAGRNHAIIMSVGFNDYDRPHENMQWSRCDPSWLKGACKLVYQYCVESQLRPTLDYWHDGVGVESGFNIVIHW